MDLIGGSEGGAAISRLAAASAGPAAACQRLAPGASEPSVTIASGFGATSAHSWLEIPVVEDVDGVAEAAVCAAGMAVSLP